MAQKTTRSLKPSRSLNRPTTTKVDRLLTAAEAADRMGVGPPFMRRLVEERRIEFVKVGKFNRFRESAVDAFIEQGTASPAKRVWLEER